VHRYATCMVKIAWSEFVRRKARLLLLFRHHAAPFATLSVLVQCSKFGFNLKFCFIILQFTALLNAEFGLAMIISLILHPISNVPRLQLCHQLILPGMVSSLVLCRAALCRAVTPPPFVRGPLLSASPST